MKRKRTSVFCVLALLAVLLPVPARAYRIYWTKHLQGLF